MIFKIAEPPAGGKGFLGIYPLWGDDGADDARILGATRDRYFSILFTRNYPSQFFERIHAALERYAGNVDVVCGWAEEKIHMSFLPLNPEVEVFRISAMNFNNLDLLEQVRKEMSPNTGRRFDLFFATAERADGLKNVPFLENLLAGIDRPISVIGYGRLSQERLMRIRKNKYLRFVWKGKADILDSDQRLDFFRDLAQSRALLVTSHVEGYCRLIGEALTLGVPVLMNSQIHCENWVHLDAGNCRLFNAHTFQKCLADILSRKWDFSPPRYDEGNVLLQELIEDYLGRRGLPRPVCYHPLSYGAVNSHRLDTQERP